MNVIYIHLFTLPVFLYYERYLIALWTATIFTTSYMCWKRNEWIVLDRHVARIGILALNVATCHPVYALGTFVGAIAYAYGNHVLAKTGEVHTVWWSFNHVIGTLMNLYFYAKLKT